MGRTFLSRRNMVGRISKAAVAASLGASLVSKPGSAAQVGEPLAGNAQESVEAHLNAGVRTYNVRHFGAKGDGKSLDTAAFQAAIDACTNDKGGTVLVPPGEFLIGSIELKSNVTFHLAAAARLLGSTNIDHYKKDVEDAPWGKYSLIYAIDAANLSIEGKGSIDGQGAEYFPGAKDDGDQVPGRPRPQLTIFLRCQDLSIHDIALVNSAYWCTHFNRCRNVYVDGVRIHNRDNFNNDGLHFEDCEHVKVSNCDVVCEDDACALFGSTRDVTVTNCTFSTRWSVFRFGGGRSENVTVSNCVIYDTFGCPIKMQVEDGSRMENMIFSNLVMNNVTGPIYVGLGSVPRNSTKPSETRPGGVVRNITFKGIRATVAPAPDLKEFPYLRRTPIDEVYAGEHRTCIDLTAYDGQFIENIDLSDIQITFAGGGSAQEAALRDVPQVSGAEYFGLGVLPAYGMYARNVRGLTLNNVRFDVAAADLRPALVFDGCEDISLQGFSAEGNSSADSLLRFVNSRDALLSACRVLTSCPAFLQVEGVASDRITIAACDLSKAASPVVFSRDARKEAVAARL
jgi:polygalacturonase